MSTVGFHGLTPYLIYDDASAAMAWLTRVFGFVERKRWPGEDGVLRNVELTVGNIELWLDGDPEYWATRGQRPDSWIGVWVDDVDAMYARVRSAGVEAFPPEDRPWGVREFQVRDPEGYTWGFLKRV
ncbi:MAG: VOC family protein [Dehalococcoidia bacterium]